MQVFNKFSLLLFLFIITFSIPSNAAIDYKPDAEKKTTISKKQKKAKKKGLFKRWKEKRVLKKLKKRQKKVKGKSVAKDAKRSKLLGISSFVALFIAIASPFVFIAIASPFVGIQALQIIALLFAVGSAIYGRHLAVSVLRQTKNQPEKYKEERKMAKKGLTFSKRTLRILLILLLLVLLGLLLLRNIELELF